MDTLELEEYVYIYNMMQHEEVEGKGDEGQVKNILLQEKTYCLIFL